MAPAAAARWDTTTRSTVFPSLGFFGAKNVDRLEVSLPAGLTALRVELPRSVVEVLSLKGVELARGNQVVRLPSTALRATASSFAKGRPRDAAAPLTTNGPVNTRREAGPWWQVELLEPADLTGLRLYNRRDGLGRRTRALVVKARTAADGAWQTVHDAQQDDLAAALAVVERTTGVQLRPPLLRRGAWSARARAAAVRHLLDSPESLTSLSRDELRLLLALVPSQPRAGSPGLDETDRRLLATLLAVQRVVVPGTATSIRSFGDVLPDRPTLRRLADDINAVGARLGSARVAITRHGLADVGSLRADTDGHLELVERVGAVFESLGHPLVLAYGSLLGMVREGAFLEHDDDVDLLFRVDAPDADGAREVLDGIKAELRQRGFRIWSNPTGLNFHVDDVPSGRHLDVFPYLVAGDRATLHMTSMRLETIDVGILEPHGRREIGGRTVGVPHAPERFLEARYGSGWSVEDPFHDWTWPLSS